MPRDPFIREKFTKEGSAARKAIKEYFNRFPKERYRTEIESWRHLQSQNFEFTMKRLREPKDAPRVDGIGERKPTPQANLLLGPRFEMFAKPEFRSLQTPPRD
jgi:hypothetical protein